MGVILGSTACPTHVLVLAVTPVYTRIARKETGTAIYYLKRNLTLSRYYDYVFPPSPPDERDVPCRYGDASRLHLRGIIAFAAERKEGNARKGYVFIGYPEDAPGNEISE